MPLRVLGLFLAASCVIYFNPFSTAVYISLYLTLSSSDVSPNWDCAKKKAKGVNIGLACAAGYTVHAYSLFDLLEVAHLRGCHWGPVKFDP